MVVLVPLVVAAEVLVAVVETLMVLPIQVVTVVQDNNSQIILDL